jgi:hypothetical protein
LPLHRKYQIGARHFGPYPPGHNFSSPIKFHYRTLPCYGPEMSNVGTLLRLLTAAALGSLIGFERERLLWADRRPRGHGGET